MADEVKSPKPPLWLPEGSVRALAFVGVLGASIYMMIAGIEIPDWYKELIYALLAFYFGTRLGAMTKGNNK